MSPVRPDVKVVGRRNEAEDHNLRDFLTRAAQPFEWFEAGTPRAEELLARHGAADAELPVLIDGELTIAPATVAAVAASWGEELRRLSPPTTSR